MPTALSLGLQVTARVDDASTVTIDYGDKLGQRTVTLPWAELRAFLDGHRDRTGAVAPRKPTGHMIELAPGETLACSFAVVLP